MKTAEERRFIGISRENLFGIAMGILLPLSAYLTWTDCPACSRNPLFFSLLPLALAVTFLMLPRGQREAACKWAFYFSAALFLFSAASGGVLSRGELSYADFPFHYFNSLETHSNLLPNFHSPKGWTDSFQLGYPPLYDLAPGEYFAYSALRTVFGRFTGPNFPYKLVVLLSFLSLPFALAFFMRRAGFSNWQAHLAGLLVFASFNDMMFFSNSRYYSGAAFALAFLGVLAEILGEGGSPRRKTASAALLLALSILFHSFIGLLAATLGVLEIAVFALVLRKAPSGKSILLASASIALGILPAAHYIAVYLNSGPFFETIRANMRETWSFVYMLAPNFSMFLLLACPLAFFLFFPGIALSDREKGGVLFSAIAALFLFALTLALHFARAQWAWDFSVLEILAMPDKLFSLAFLFACATASVALCFALSSKGLPLAFASAFVLALALTAQAGYRHALFTGPSNPDTDFHITRSFEWSNTFGNVHFLALEDGIFSEDSRKETADLLSRLSSLPSSNGRILLEINSDSEGHMFGGFAYSLFPEKTGRDFIGGPTFSMLLPMGKDLYSNYLPGRPFGKNISSFLPEELSALLRRTNAEYIVVWTNESKGYFSENSPYFEEINNPAGGLFSIYRNRQATGSFLTAGADGSPIENSAVRFGPSEKEFSICAEKAPEEFDISMRHAPEWRAFFEPADGTGRKDLELREDELGLMRVRLGDAAGCGRLVLVYEERPGFSVLLAASLASFAFLALASIFPEGRSRKKRRAPI